MKRFILCSLFICFIANISYTQSKIGKAENSLIEDKEQTKIKKSNRVNDSDLVSSFFLETVVQLIAEVFLYSSYYTLIESPFEVKYRASRASITKRPYHSSKKGNYTYEGGKDLDIFRTELSTRYIHNNSKLKGMHLNTNLRFMKRLGLEANVLQLWENNTNFGTDNLAIYTLLAKYYRIRTEKFDAWWGLGTSYVDGKVNRFGFTYGLGTELFFIKPLSLKLNFNQTFINSEAINKFNGLLNYHVNQYKLIGGYEHLKIGTEGFSNVTLGIGLFL